MVPPAANFSPLYSTATEAVGGRSTCCHGAGRRKRSNISASPPRWRISDGNLNISLRRGPCLVLSTAYCSSADGGVNGSTNKKDGTQSMAPLGEVVARCLLPVRHASVELAVAVSFRNGPSDRRRCLHGANKALPHLGEKDGSADPCLGGLVWLPLRVGAADELLGCSAASSCTMRRLPRPHVPNLGIGVGTVSAGDCADRADWGTLSRPSDERLLNFGKLPINLRRRAGANEGRGASMGASSPTGGPSPSSSTTSPGSATSTGAVSARVGGSTSTSGGELAGTVGRDANSAFFSGGAMMINRTRIGRDSNRLSRAMTTEESSWPRLDTRRLLERPPSHNKPPDRNRATGKRSERRKTAHVTRISSLAATPLKIGPSANMASTKAANRFLRSAISPLGNKKPTSECKSPD
mmetsp:Transcript_22723/g.51323  ORF Transcript_22723/g.51323 Transcript_22723/m.51323 type:complete len:410 (-) Transcript_22723:1455-2684(-)